MSRRVRRGVPRRNRHFWKRFIDWSMPAGEMYSLTDAVNQLTKLATSVTTPNSTNVVQPSPSNCVTRAAESVTKGKRYQAFWATPSLYEPTVVGAGYRCSACLDPSSAPAEGVRRLRPER